MTTSHRRTIELPADQAAWIDRQIAAGRFASADEAVSSGLLALADHDLAIEAWLNREVAAAFDACASDPARLLSGQEVSAAVRARHAVRTGSPGDGSAG